MSPIKPPGFPARSLKLFCTSPLSQRPLIATVGQTITLKTPRVFDDNVLYNWNLQGKVYPSNADTLSLPITKDLTTIFSGDLYVSSNGVQSTHFNFPVSIADNSSPVITCLNNSDLNDSVNIYTSASPFSFRIEITNQTTAAGAVSVQPCINGTAFDAYDTSGAIPGGLICSKIIIDTILVNHPGDSLQLFITFAGMDGAMFSKIFWLHYDSTLVNLDLPEIVLTVPRNGEAVSNPAITLLGAVIFNNYTYDSLYLAIQLNNTRLNQVPVVSKNSPKWSANVLLTQLGLTTGVALEVITADGKKYGPKTCLSPLVLGMTFWRLSARTMGRKGKNGVSIRGQLNGPGVQRRTPPIDT